MSPERHKGRASAEELEVREEAHMPNGLLADGAGKQSKDGPTTLQTKREITEPNRNGPEW